PRKSGRRRDSAIGRKGSPAGGRPGASAHGPRAGIANGWVGDARTDLRRAGGLRCLARQSPGRRRPPGVPRRPARGPEVISLAPWPGATGAVAPTSTRRRVLKVVLRAVRPLHGEVAPTSTRWRVLKDRIVLAQVAAAQQLHRHRPVGGY